MCFTTAKRTKNIEAPGAARFVYKTALRQRENRPSSAPWRQTGPLGDAGHQPLSCTEHTMNAGWIVFGICVVFVIGAAIPLLKDLGRDQTARPPRRETLRDWRNQK
jgi:hypothetical protein